jgi:hypothetical protein
VDKSERLDQKRYISPLPKKEGLNSHWLCILWCSRLSALRREATMNRQEYVAWLSEIDELSAAQRAEAGRALSGQLPLEAVVSLLEERIGAERRCPHCAAQGAVIRG